MDGEGKLVPAHAQDLFGAPFLAPASRLELTCISFSTLPPSFLYSPPCPAAHRLPSWCQATFGTETWGRREMQSCLSGTSQHGQRRRERPQTRGQDAMVRVLWDFLPS